MVEPCTKITFALRWLGSQAIICDKLEANNASELQKQAALLICEPNRFAVRVMCSMPPNNWVCLTPIRCTGNYDAVVADWKRGRDAWVQVQNMSPGQVVPVYVSKHPPASVLANQIVRREFTSFYEFARLRDNLRSNFHVGHAALLHGPWFFLDVWKTLNTSLRSNRAFATSVFSCVYACNKFHLACEWHEDREMVLHVARSIHLRSSEADQLHLKLAHGPFQHDKEVLLAFVAKDGFLLRRAPDELKQDKDVALTAVRQNGHALEYAPDELKQDKDVVLAAVTNHGLALRFAGDALKGDKHVVLAAVNSCGSCFPRVLYNKS